MARLEITVTRPFLLEVLRLNQDGKLSAEAVRDIFEITEDYLFRRNVCEVPTNALNKVFLTLGSRMVVPKDAFIRWVESHTGGGG